jgi:hypothetical protein
LLSFIDAYTLWRKLPFPPGGFGDEIPETKGDLAVADEYVTVVIRFVEHGVFKPAVPNVLELLDDILRRTEQLCDDESGQVRTIAREQHAYAALLRLVYEQFLEKGSDPSASTKTTASPITERGAPRSA